MSFLWRTTTYEPEPYLLSVGQLLAIRVLITSLLLLGIIYGSLIIATFARYGDAMDQAWKKRINGWIDAKFTETFVDEPQPVYAPYYPPPPPPPPRSNGTWTPWGQTEPEKRRDTVDELAEELTMLKQVGRDLNRSMPPDNWIPLPCDSPIALPPPHEVFPILKGDGSTNQPVETNSASDENALYKPRHASKPTSSGISGLDIRNNGIDATATQRDIPEGGIEPLPADYPWRDVPQQDALFSVPLPMPPPPLPSAQAHTLPAAAASPPRPSSHQSRPRSSLQQPSPHSKSRSRSRSPQIRLPELSKSYQQHHPAPDAPLNDELGKGLEQGVQSNQHWRIDEDTKERVLSWLSSLPPSPLPQESSGDHQDTPDDLAVLSTSHEEVVVGSIPARDAGFGPSGISRTPLS